MSSSEPNKIIKGALVLLTVLAAGLGLSALSKGSTDHATAAAKVLATVCGLASAWLWVDAARNPKKETANVLAAIQSAATVAFGAVQFSDTIGLGYNICNAVLFIFGVFFVSLCALFACCRASRDWVAGKAE